MAQSLKKNVNKLNTIEKWTKSCILPFNKKGDLRINKNNKGINFYSYNF